MSRLNSSPRARSNTASVAGMKSLLVDVLREAKNGRPEQTLSDSGSFDTTQDEIPPTANDADISEHDADKKSLSLYETTASLDAAPSAASDVGFSETNELTFDDAQVDAVNEPHEPSIRVSIASAHSDAPRLARFAPLACVALAAIAAASWVGYQQLKLSYAESQFALAKMGLADAQASDVGRAATAQSTERFPFIKAGETVSEGERVE